MDVSGGKPRRSFHELSVELLAAAYPHAERDWVDRQATAVGVEVRRVLAEPNDLPAADADDDGWAGQPAVRRIQRRIVKVLMINEVASGVGVAVGISVSALLAQSMVGVALSGVAQSLGVLGGALMAIPATLIMGRYGRRLGIFAMYLVGAVGSIAIIASARVGSVLLMFVGMFLFGAANTGKFQSRFAAADLSESAWRGRHLSWIVWGSTFGAVAGPNLAAPSAALVRGTGLPELAAPYVVAGAIFVLCAVWLLVALRPDPLLLAKRLAGGGDADHQRTGHRPRRTGLVDAARIVWRRPASRLGASAMAVGHFAMVAVMAMTPVHIGMTHHGAGVLTIVGVVVGLHIGAMYALSPIVGRLTDRYGPASIIQAGAVLLVVGCLLASAAGDSAVWLAAGLIVVGLGWSCTMISGSTLLTADVPLPVRPAAQGLADLCTGVAGAVASVLAGLIVWTTSYTILAVLAALTVVPLFALAVRQTDPPPPTGSAQDRLHDGDRIPNLASLAERDAVALSHPATRHTP